MKVYLCGPDFENILCGIYEAFMGSESPDKVRLELREEFQEMELFTEYVEVNTAQEKVRAVIGFLTRKLSHEVYEKVYAASLSQEKDRLNQIVGFLSEAFRYGSEVVNMLHLPSVYAMFRMQRNVYNEHHQMTQFVRFARTAQGVLVSRIHPKNDILPLLALHFADRLPEENWVIFDKSHGKVAVHQKGADWFLTDAVEGQEIDGGGSCLKENTDEELYKALWKTFFDTAAIQERKNHKCQRNHLPMRFRPYMTEFNL